MHEKPARGRTDVRSRVEVVADAADDGSTVLARMHAEGGLAVRRTASSTVHLVGTAAGPLDGDVVEIDVTVRAGATLRLTGVAATLALPGRGPGPSTWSLALRVGDGGRLDCAPQPLVVCAGARVRATTRVEARGSALVDVLEQVVLGRHGERGGDWDGRLVAAVGGTPVLRQRQSSAILAAGPLPAGERPPRVLVSRLLLGPGIDADHLCTTSGDAVGCRLAGGGLLLTSTGRELGAAMRDLDAVWSAPAVTTAARRL
jgi:urease accessory protein